MNKFKICSSCKRKLLLKSFSIDVKCKDKLSCICKKCANNRSKEWYEAHKLRRNRYDLNYNKLPVGIYKALKQSAKNRNLEICSRQEFIDWYNKQERECVYCSIPEYLLKPLEWGSKVFRSRLTIDRNNNNNGYILDNMCLSCYKCNLMKNDILNFDEMKEIGNKYIKPKWKYRFNNIRHKN